MPTNRETDLTTLIAKCECAIRRGDVPHLETLHTIQQHLVTARDAREQAQTEANLRAAMDCYYQHIPATERKTTFDTLTEHFEQIQSQFDVSDRPDHQHTVKSTTK